MRPVRLEMEGFGAFRDACVVDLSDIELVALVGATGSGKSTIIDAITFALYGSVARYDDNRAVAPAIHQTGTRARVRLDFEVGDERYTAVRLVQRTPKGATTKEARLERGDEVLAADARSMSTEVARLLGLDIDQFNRTVVLPQGRFADFLHDNPADRQATLRQLLGLGIYRQVAGVARQRAAALRSQVDALRPELDDGEQELTADQRALLVARHALVVEARTTFIDALDRLQPAAVRLADIDRRLAEVDAHLGLLAEVREPGDVAELDRRAQACDADVERATRDLAAARDRRRAADIAAADGPDLAACTAQLHRRREATTAISELAETTTELVAAEERHHAARGAADEVAAVQAELDGRVVTTRGAEQEARRAVGDGPNPVRIEHWMDARARRATSQVDADAAASAAATARHTLDPLAAALAVAEEAEADARVGRDDLQQRAGAAGFVGLLAVGAPCPLCLHAVEALPEHHVSEDLERVGVALAAAEAALIAARHDLQRAERIVGDLAAHAEAAQRALEAIDVDLAGVPDDAALGELLAEATALRTAAAAADADLRAADAAAAAHRSDPANVECLARAEAAAAETVRLGGLAESRRSRRDRLVGELTGVPLEAELESSIAEAERLAGERQSAAATVAMAEAGHEAAITRRAAVVAEVRHAMTELLATRDRLAALEPPVVDGERPAADWAVLTSWASARRTELTSTRGAVAGDRDALAAERDGLERVAREQCARVLDAATGDLVTLRDRLTRSETSAVSALAVFDERRERLAALRERVAALLADATVATRLGQLLQADGFEAWLMQAALDELVAAATVRLRELSSGQFSLELVERDFMVRDHANADELRSARTLSGGETFLASLSLALALADATSELSPDGAPMVESIFLDEGFGSLDPGTLDVVAAAIEELGSTGRMVAIVTHIRELADRMPVRLEVTKAGSSSSVERIEA